METNNKNYDNSNSGALFKNKGKEEQKNERDTSKWPEYQGKANVNGVDCYLSAWVKKPKKGGDTFMSLSFEPINESQQQSKTAQNNNQNPKQDSDDDDLPF